jgi:cytochrome P450
LLILTNLPRANTIPHNGIIRYLGLWNTERLVIVSPKALGEVLTTKSYDFVKPELFRAAIGRVLGMGLVMAEGNEHKIQRKNLMPAFAFRHVKNLYPLLWEKAGESVQAMVAEVNAQNVNKLANTEGNILDAADWASRVTLDIIGVAGIGQDFGSINDPDALLSRTYESVFKPSREAQILGMIALTLPSWFVTSIPLPQNKRIEEAAATIRDICRQNIRDKKAKLANGQLVDADILSMALKSGGFSDENLVDQMMTFLAAGHETSTMALTWAIYLLCKHRDVQTRLRKEIHASLPSLDSPVTSREIDNLPYLHAVCNEVLRYYPPVAITLREAACDTVITGVAVPKGTRVMLVPHAINRNEELWGPDADKFIPERWLQAGFNGGAPTNYAFLTFIHGPRSCIGQSFARGEFSCLLAAWIGRFEFELQDGRLFDERNLKIQGQMTSRLVDGLYVKTKVVEGW